MRHFRPSRRGPAWHLARKYRLEQHIPNETFDFAVKFRLVFRYETVVFRGYVLALLLVGLWRKFEAYLVYLSLIWGKIPRRYSRFQKFRHFSYMFPRFPARISDMRNRFSALSAQSRLNCLKSLAKLFNFVVFQSVSIFSILNHPCSFMLCYNLFGVFLSLYSIIFRFPSI